MARKTNIYTLLHNANIGEYVTDSVDIFDSYSNQSQYDFNKSIRGLIASAALIGSYSNLKLKITPSSFYVKSSQGCTLTCEVTFNGEDYTDVVIKWQIERISVNPQDDLEWFEEKNNGETPLTNVIELSAKDLNGDAAMFIVTAIITSDMKCDNSVSLMGYMTQGLFTFDLNNQIDFVATDNMYEVQWDQNIETRATLTYGYKKIIPDEIEFEYNGLPEGCASFNSKEEFDIVVTLPKGQKVNYNNALIVSVSGTYNDETYRKQAIFTIKADTDSVIYNIAPSRDKIRLSSTGVYTPTTLSCGVRKQTINGITYPEELPETLKLTMIIDEGEEQEITPKTVITLFGDNMTVINSGVIFTLYERGQFLDSEWIPVISDGVTGESTIKLDLDNEMDAIPVDANYMVLDDTVISSNATMYYGYDEMTFVRNAATHLEVSTPEEDDKQYLENIKTSITYKNENKLLYITLTCKKGDLIPKRINVTLYAMGSWGVPGEEGYKAKLQSAVFSVMPMIVSDETPLYYLIPSANSIKINKSNARQPINIGVTTKKRTGETGYITTDYGYVMYQIDDDKPQRYTKPLDTENIGEQILFEYYDENDELLDRETVPAIFDGKDGESGRSIKDLHEYYLATATLDDIPSYDDEWIQDEFPDETLFNEDYPYLWNYEETIYINYGTDASVWRSTPSIITHYVKGIKDIDEYYLAVPENSGIDSSYVKEQDIFLTKNGLYEWQLSVIPEMSDISAYLWNFERIYYDNDTFTTTTPGIIGIHGESNFYIDIDNQLDYIAVNEYDEVIPSNVRYDESIVVYPKYDSNGNIVMPRDRDVIFEDNSTNIGTVVIKSNFTVYYGNTRAQIKGIGFQYSDSSVFRAMAYNIPATIYPIIIPEEGSDDQASEPDLKGSYRNPYTVDELKHLESTIGQGTAMPSYQERGDVYVSGYIVGYTTVNGGYTIAPGDEISVTDITGFLMYDRIIGNDEVAMAAHCLYVFFDPSLTDIAIYNSNPEEVNPEDDDQTPKTHPYGINVKNRIEYLDKIVTIMGIKSTSGSLHIFTPTDYAELYFGEDIITFSSIYGAYDLSSIDFYVFVKPSLDPNGTRWNNPTVIPKINWVRVIVDIEAFGKIHRSYAILSLYAAAPGENARFYQLQPSHKQIQRRKDGTYVPTVDTNITCHIVKRIGNDYLYNVEFYDPDDNDHDTDAFQDVSLFYAYDSGDYIYLPFTEEEYTHLVHVKNLINAGHDGESEEYDGVSGLEPINDEEDAELIRVSVKYRGLLNIPPMRDTQYREKYDITTAHLTDPNGCWQYDPYTTPEYDPDTKELINLPMGTVDNDITYGQYMVAHEDHNRRSYHCGAFPTWKLRDIFNCYLNPDGTFKTDENGNALQAFSQISFLLTDAKTGEQVDLIQIPVLYDGEEPVIADLTNEMDAVAMNELNFTIAKSTLQTTFTVRYSTENQALKASTELYDDGIVNPITHTTTKRARAMLNLVVADGYSLPLIKFTEIAKNGTVLGPYYPELPANIIPYDEFVIITTDDEKNALPHGISQWEANNTYWSLNNPAKIYWEYTHDIKTNEYNLIIYVSPGIGNETYTITDGAGTRTIDLWSHNRFIIDVLSVVEHVSSSPDDPQGMMDVERSCLFTIHGIACGEDGVIYQIEPTYKNIVVNDIGEYFPDTIDCLITRRYGTLDPSIYRDFSEIYKKFLIGPKPRTEHEFGNDALVIGYSIDDENNLNNNGYQAAHWWVHKDFNDGEIASDDANDTNYFPFPLGSYPTNPNDITSILNNPQGFFNKIEYPSIPSYRIGRQITFYLFQKMEVPNPYQLPNVTPTYQYKLLDVESVPIVHGAHEINPNLVNGTEDGGLIFPKRIQKSVEEAWTYTPNTADIAGKNNFRLITNGGMLTSPKISMLTGKEFVVSLECRLITSTVEDGVTVDTPITEDIELVPPKYTDITETIEGGKVKYNVQIPPEYVLSGNHKENYELPDDFLSNNYSSSSSAGSNIGIGYHYVTLHFYDENQKDPDTNSKGLVYYVGHPDGTNESWARNIFIITNWGNSDKQRYKEWTRIKFNVYQADDIPVDTENAYFTLTYRKPNTSPYILQIRHIKLEYGDTATTWIPSVWDTKGEARMRVIDLYSAVSYLHPGQDPKFYTTSLTQEKAIEEFIEYLHSLSPNDADIYPRGWESPSYRTGNTAYFKYTIGGKDYYWYRSAKEAVKYGEASPASSIAENPKAGLDNPYLWNVEIVINQHDEIGSMSVPALITTSGEEIIAEKEWYLATNIGSGVTYDTPGWVEFDPSEVESLDKYTFGLSDVKNYLWNYEEIWYSLGTYTRTDPIIVSVFNSNIRIDLDNEVDAVPVDSQSYILSATKDIQLNTTLSFYQGTTRMEFITFYATIDLFSTTFINYMQVKNETDDDYHPITFNELIDCNHLDVDVFFIKKLILNATDHVNTSGNKLDPDLGDLKAYVETLNTEEELLLFFTMPKSGTNDDPMEVKLYGNISLVFIIERMLLNVLYVKARSSAGTLDNTTLFIPLYRCLRNTSASSGQVLDMYPPVDEELLATFNTIGQNTIKGQTELKVAVIAAADSAVNYSLPENANKPTKKFPKLIDQRVPIRFNATAAHRADTELTGEGNPVDPNTEESKGEVYSSTALFGLMIFEGDGVYQLLPSCTEIKETSLGIQYATAAVPNFTPFKEDGTLYMDNITENTSIENIDFITCKILYRKGAEDTSLFETYTPNVSTWLVMEISDDGGAYMNNTIWNGQIYLNNEGNEIFVPGPYAGSPYDKIYIAEETRHNLETQLDYTVTIPSAVDTGKYYNIGTGLYPQIPLYTEKVAKRLFENNETKSNWFISNAITFKLKLILTNDQTGQKTEVLVDSETIPVVKDGQDGLDGASQARNFLDGTDDGSEFTRWLTIRHITDDYYASSASEDSIGLPYIISPPVHMYVNNAISNAIELLAIQQGGRRYARFSGLLKLSTFSYERANDGTGGYKVSWGKPYIAITLAIIVTDGKGLIHEGVYYTTDILFNTFTDDIARKRELYANLNTTQEITVINNIEVANYLQKPKSGDNITTILTNELGQYHYTSLNPYFGIKFRATAPSGGVSSIYEKDVFIDLFANDTIDDYKEAHPAEDDQEVNVPGILMDEYIPGMHQSTEDDLKIEYTLKWFATPTGQTNINTGTIFQEDSVTHDAIYPYIKILLENPTLYTNKIMDVSVININTIDELTTIRKQENNNIMLDELIEIPDNFMKNTLVKLSTFMLPEIEIQYNSFKLETEMDAPKAPSTWTLSEDDKKRNPNANILFGAETGYYENQFYWIVPGITDSMQSLYLTSDPNSDEGAIIIKQRRSSDKNITAKNLNIITPNSITHYAFSFDAMYDGNDMGGPLDVYFIFSYNPPFDDVESAYTATTVDDNEYSYEYEPGYTVVPPVLGRNQIFDAVSGTYVYAHEQFELTKGFRRYTMFTNNARVIDPEILEDAPYAYEFYIKIVHPGAGRGTTNVYIKKPKLEKGLIPTPYQINLDEYKGCTYDLVPYFETIEVRTEKEPKLEHTPFDVNYVFNSSIAEINQSTGEIETKNLNECNIFQINEGAEDDNIMDIFSYYARYTNITDTTTIAYISSGLLANTVETPVITHDISTGYAASSAYSYRFTITSATEFARIYYYIDYKLLYLTDIDAGIEDYELVVLNNGTIWPPESSKILTRPGTVYAIGVRDLYNNSLLAYYTFEQHPQILNNEMNFGEYESYTDDNSLIMGNFLTNVQTLKSGTKLLWTDDFTGKIVNTFIFTFDSTNVITNDVNIAIQKYTYSGDKYNPIKNGPTYNIIIYKSEYPAEHIVKYTENIIVDDNQYLGMTSNDNINITLRNVEQVGGGTYILNNSIQSKFKMNIDVGYTHGPTS